jgi:DNA-binding NarL/FixJ family response regulator
MAEHREKRRIFLVDDHPLVREWLTMLINQQSDLVICGEAEDAPRALAAMEKLQPDAAVIDVTLSSGSGIELIKDIRRCCAGVAVLVLSMHDESLYAERALRAGARGYVMKRETTKNVIAALRKILDGGIYVSENVTQSMAKKIVSGRSEADESPVAQLSDRELSVFEMLGRGLETKQIGDSLSISPKTVQVYCARIKEKVGVQTHNELLREAVRWIESRK